jgi:hypothetical protein
MVWACGTNGKGETSKTSMYYYRHHRVEEEKEDQDEAGQKAYEKR